MNTQTTLIATGALVVGLVGGFLLNATLAPTHNMADGSTMLGMQHGMQAEMHTMTNTLAGASGEAFDRTFLSEMIIHHEGAVAMAELALQSAEREEIKTLARAIIAAQETEINLMREWQSTWFGR